MSAIHHTAIVSGGNTAQRLGIFGDQGTAQEFA